MHARIASHSTKSSSKTAARITQPPKLPARGTRHVKAESLPLPRVLVVAQVHDLGRGRWCHGLDDADRKAEQSCTDSDADHPKLGHVLFPDEVLPSGPLHHRQVVGGWVDEDDKGSADGTTDRHDAPDARNQR